MRHRCATSGLGFSRQKNGANAYDVLLGADPREDAERVSAVVDATGEVLCDSEADPSTMVNHGDRPEVRAALATGTGLVCPADSFVAAGSVCRGAAGVCDVAENCTGSGAACPADGFVDSSVICRPAAGACDVDERCTGTGPVPRRC